MADHCGNCRSTDVLHGLHEFTCLECGAVTCSDGTVGRHGTKVVTTTELHRDKR